VSTHLLLEAAVRSLVMGAIIFVALRLLRIEQVRARRTAWLLALAGALAMPALVAAQIGPRLLPEVALAALPAATSHRSIASPFAGASRSAAAAGTAPAAWTVPPLESGSAKAFRAAEEPAAALDSAPASARDHTGERVNAAQFGNTVITLGNMATTLAVFGYCVVAAVLTLRLFVGVGFALRLRNQAERMTFPFDPELDVRTTQRLATPVTIGSSVLLPNAYSLWDGATLRVVLSHERAHVRQMDFYVHALAGLHCALFWFNPFSWWLQRQLSELGEALSDCAAVEQAESRTSYAETLLAFATRARWPMAGVAMAGASNLTPRIERLLSDRGFERSFAPRQRLPFVAAGIVMLAMVASTSMVRVHAAPTAPPPPPRTALRPRPAPKPRLTPAQRSTSKSESFPTRILTPTSLKPATAIPSWNMMARAASRMMKGFWRSIPVIRASCSIQAICCLGRAATTFIFSMTASLT
jgi:beta-lactamase regulating signal transducer with metallopeptidase domain